MRNRTSEWVREYDPSKTGYGATEITPIKGYQVKDSGERLSYASGMVRDSVEGKPRFDFLMPLGVPFDEQLLTRIAAHMEKGARKYGARNWEKANSEEELERAIASTFRHFVQWMAGEQDEDHAAAVYFGIMFAETLRWKLANGAGVTSDTDSVSSDGGRAGSKTDYELPPTRGFNPRG